VQQQYWRRGGVVQRQSTTDVRIHKCCVRIIPRIRTGGIRNWGHNRAVKTNRLVSVSYGSKLKQYRPFHASFYRIAKDTLSELRSSGSFDVVSCLKYGVKSYVPLIQKL